MSSLENESTTVDTNEVVRYNGLSSIWWDKTDKIKSLHTYNMVRIPFMIDGLISTGVVKQELIGTDKPLKGLSILDVGCGAGITSEALAKLGCTVVGIDISPNLIEVAKQHAALDPSLSNLKYLLEAPEEHAKRNYEKYDAVVTCEVVDHVTNQDLFLSSCIKCLKPGGSLFITTKNKTTFAWLTLIVFAEYICRVIPIGANSYDQFISIEDMKKILEGYQCKTKEVRGFFYNVFTNNWRWTSTTIASTYGLHAIKK